MNKIYLAGLSVLFALPLMGQDSCEGDDGFDWAPPGTDFAAAGPSTVEGTPASLSVPSGCTLEYTRYMPGNPAGGPLIVLSHGFQRDQVHMVDLATHLASWGLEVVTPSLCHSVPADNDIEGDAADLIALATAQGARSVIYMGHSAGGLRSILAAPLDSRSVSVIGLDAVDAQDIALDAAPMLAVPLLGIVGEPSACNAASNGVAVYEVAQDARALRVTESDHCDYEGPTDALCTSFCQGSNDAFDDGTIGNAITGLATSAALWQSGLSDEGAGWWEPGEPAFDWMENAGLTHLLVL